MQQICVCQKSNLTTEYNRVKLRAACERRQIYGSLLSQGKECVTSANGNEYVTVRCMEQTPRNASIKFADERAI